MGTKVPVRIGREASVLDHGRGHAARSLDLASRTSAQAASSETMAIHVHTATFLDALNTVVERAPDVISRIVTVLGISVLTAWGLVSAYILKRALRIDVVPGLDVLPDEEIEAALEYLRQLISY